MRIWAPLWRSGRIFARIFKKSFRAKPFQIIFSHRSRRTTMEKRALDLIFKRFAYTKTIFSHFAVFAFRPPFRCLLQPLGNNFPSSWLFFGSLWVALGSSWPPFGRFGSAFRRSWASPGRLLGASERFLQRLLAPCRSEGRPMSLQTPSRTLLGLSTHAFGPDFLFFER